MAMNFRRLAMVLVAVLVLTLLSGPPLCAEASEGEGPFDAMAPTNEWQTLNPEQYRWYVFHFDYVEDELNKPIEIKMLTEPHDSALLTIRNQAQVDEWVRDGTHDHFGCTTMVNEDANVDGRPDFSQWAGTLRESGDYYLVVEHARGMTEPANYHFTVNGENIAFPTAEAIVVETMASAAPEEAPELMSPQRMAMAAPATAPEEALELLGTGPDYAMAPNGEWNELESGQYHWYKFIFDESEEWTEPLTIRFYTEPLDGAALTVRNGYQAELWRQDGTHDHLGCCTRPVLTSQVESDDEDAEEGIMIEESEQLAHAIWSADLTESGVYYLVVEHAKDSTTPTFYRFDVLGQGFDF